MTTTTTNLAPSTTALYAILSFFLLPLIIVVHGHGFLSSPRSRQFRAYEDGTWGSNLANVPLKESEPQSASGGVKDNRSTCGMIGYRNYDYPKNSLGGSLPPKPQACYEVGINGANSDRIIELEVSLSAHHRGHFEFRACPIEPGEAASQDCFDSYPLTFISDLLYGANLDPNYPERAYIPDSATSTNMTIFYANVWQYRYKFQLPDDLSGELVLIQWHYFSANFCTSPGYSTYNWPVGEHWYSVSDQKPPCTNSQSGEQFRNCAEVRIVKDCQQSPPTAGPTPTYGLSPNATRTPSRRPSRKPSRKPSKKPTSVMPTSRPKQLLTRKPATMAPAPLMCPASSNQCGPYITCDDIGFPNYCCSADGVSSCL